MPPPQSRTPARSPWYDAENTDLGTGPIQNCSPNANDITQTITAAHTFRFTTRFVYGNGTLTLIGGDRLLTTSDLAELAKTAVAGLKSADVEDVKVRVDDSLFPEPTLANGWNDGYYPDTVAPVRALAVDGHSVTDTSLDAGKVFAGQLAADGITVNGEVIRGRAETTDVPVASHESPRLADAVHRLSPAAEFADVVSPHGSRPQFRSTASPRPWHSWKPWSPLCSLSSAPEERMRGAQEAWRGEADKP